MERIGNKSDSLKMYRDEKTNKSPGPLRMILFVVIFAYVKHFDSCLFIRMCKSWNEKDKVLKHSISVGSIPLQICVM